MKIIKILVQALIAAYLCAITHTASAQVTYAGNGIATSNLINVDTISRIMGPDTFFVSKCIRPL